MNYVPLYIKTENSLLNSMIRIDELIKKALELNLKALTITDNNLFGAREFYLACMKNNIKPIIGMELTIEKHVFIVYAKNKLGYQNLMKLSTLMSEKGLEIKDIDKYSSDLIAIIPYDSKDLYLTLNKIYQYIFLGYKNEIERNVLTEIDSKHLIYVNETLYLEKKDYKYLNYLYAIAQLKPVTDIGKNDNYLKVKEEIIDIDLKNNQYIYDECNVVMEEEKDLLPIYECPNNQTSYEYLRYLCKEGLKQRFGKTVPKIYIERLKYELDIIHQMGFDNYFLVVWDYVNFAKEHDILVGPGRGSAAGSLVSYCLKITNIDPIRYRLLFERFLNPERITMPDIDIDFENTRRDEVINYCIQKYGEKKVAGIITFGTLGAKQVVRDVARTMDLSLDMVDSLCRMLDSRLTLNENYQQNKNLVNRIQQNKELKKLYMIASKLEGLKRHTSIHAAGIVMCNRNLDEIIPLYKNSGMYLTGYSMNYLEDLGLLKMDFLSLKNLTLIDHVLKDLKKDGITLSLDDIPLNDKKTLEIFSTVNTVGIFQFESRGMKNFLRKLKPNSLEDIIAALALYRPGPMGNIDHYIKRKQGKEKINYYHPNLEEVLKPTYGILIYQEQIMQVANIMASYSLGEADVLRRAMSKKKEQVLLREREKFISRAIQNGYSEKVSIEVYELILKFAAYGFNRAHSVGYAMVSYQMAYLKAYYPMYFMRNMLTNVIGAATSTKDYIYECKLNHIPILKPDINISDMDYIITKKGIVFALCNIKNVGNNAASIIVEERKKEKYKDIYNFIARTYSKAINRKTLLSLIYAGCFDSFGLNRHTLVENLDVILNYAEVITYLDEESTLKPVLEILEEYDKRELVEKEKEVLGFYLTDHPVLEYRLKHQLNLSVLELEDKFDKYVNIIMSVKSIKKINTKNNDQMCFIEGEDAEGSIDMVLFPSQYKTCPELKINDIIKVYAHVEKRFDKLQLVIRTIEIL